MKEIKIKCSLIAFRGSFSYVDLRVNAVTDRLENPIQW